MTAGSFLIDAETRLNPAAGSIYIGGSGSGKPGGITVRPTTPDDDAEKIAAAMAKLTPENRKLAQTQRMCPIRHEPLGAMGIPVKLVLNSIPLFVCCNACVAEAKVDPAKTLAQVEEYKRKGVALSSPSAKQPRGKLTDEDIADIRKGLAKLPQDEQKSAETQRYCPILDKPLGSMGKPIKVDLGNKRSIYICCQACSDKAQKDPDAVLKLVEDFKKLPPILPEGKK